MQRDQQHQGAHKKIDRMWREERSHLPLQTSRSENVVVRQKPSFFFCACRSIRRRISQLLSDWFNIRQAASHHANPICGACDGWAGGQCAGTNHSADDASATGLAHHLLAFHTSAFSTYFMDGYLAAPSCFINPASAQTSQSSAARPAPWSPHKRRRSTRRERKFMPVSFRPRPMTSTFPSTTSFRWPTRRGMVTCVRGSTHSQDAELRWRLPRPSVERRPPLELWRFEASLSETEFGEGSLFVESIPHRSPCGHLNDLVEGADQTWRLHITEHSAETAAKARAIERRHS